MMLENYQKVERRLLMPNFPYGTADILRKLGVSRQRLLILREGLKAGKDYIKLSSQVILYTKEALDKLKQQQKLNKKFNTKKEK